MCDTFVAVGNKTDDQGIIFGKNSDRHPNEPQIIEFIEGGSTSQETVKCTYIDIPQVDRINSILISRPIWIWGAEMGANDKGVVIGNEAVWTTLQKFEERLIGMDILRLVLERADTAKEAIDVIAELLRNYGQGGNCGLYSKDYYDNSFIVADKNEAWVIETAGEYWIAEKVKGIRTISNILTIENSFDRIHPELINHAIETYKCRDEYDFNFREQYKSRFMSAAAMGDKRRACTLKVLNEDDKVSPRTAMRALRSHNTDNKFNPRKSSMASPCLHASSMLTPSQTTASMVSHLGDQDVHWMTGTSAPCISIFKPFKVAEFENKTMNAGKMYTSGSLWWDNEILHRKAIKNYEINGPIIRKKMSNFENELIAQVYGEDPSFDENTTNESLRTHHTLIKNFGEMEVKHDKRLLEWRYRRYWDTLSKKVGLI